MVCVDRSAASVVGGPERDLTAGVPSGAVASYQTLASEKSHVEEYTLCLQFGYYIPVSVIFSYIF